jgi:excisionase family DNA binding protein
MNKHVNTQSLPTDFENEIWQIYLRLTKNLNYDFITPSQDAIDNVEDSHYDLGHPILENKIMLPAQDDEWLTTEDAAEFLKLSVASLRNETSNGKIPYYKLGGRNRYNKNDLRKLLLSKKRGGSNGN